MSGAFDPRRGTGRRSLGQNFLVDRGIQARIVEAVTRCPGGAVLEIGPGKGALTGGSWGWGTPWSWWSWTRRWPRPTGSAGADQAPHVSGAPAGHPGRGPGRRHPDPARSPVVGNIPYNITTPILFHLLERPRPAGDPPHGAEGGGRPDPGGAGTRGVRGPLGGGPDGGPVERVLPFRPAPSARSPRGFGGDPDHAPPTRAPHAEGGGGAPDPHAGALPVAAQAAGQSPSGTTRTWG
jgi:hypothetical protein